MLDLIERKTEDLDRLTVAIAQGYAISMSAEAAAKWRAEHAAPVTHSPEDIQRQAASIARIRRLFPNAVKTRPN